jgi:tetratricopeptide (TPR) repeat protein
MNRLSVTRWIITAGALVSLALLGPQIGSTQDVYSLFDTGTGYLKEGRFDDAIAALSQAIDLEPNYADAYSNRGLAYYEKREYAQALEDFKQAIIINPNDEKAHNNAALVYYRQQDYPNAETHYQLALSLSAEEKPYHADVHNNLGAIYAKKGMQQEALNAYNNAIRITKALNLGYTDAFYNRANLFYDLKRYDEAIADYTETVTSLERARDAAHNVSDAYYNRGLSYYQQGQYDEALADYERALEHKPDFTWALYSMGLTCFVKKDYERALSAYRKVLDIDADFADAYLGMALVYQETGPREEFLSSLNKSCNLGNAQACDTLKKLEGE